MTPVDRIEQQNEPEPDWRCEIARGPDERPDQHGHACGQHQCAVGANLHVAVSLADLETAFDGVRYYSLAENKQALQGDFSAKTFADVLQAAKKAGILTKDVTAAELIDPRFVAAAQ